ncbi:MAG: hypothetical protein PHV20_01780 [Bacteroidales bacterium]|nr:hypothetical protein [Bacteroidales bacterium]
MKNIWWILLMLIALFAYMNRNVEIKKIEFVNSVEDVTDSLTTLRNIVNSIPNESRMHFCYINYNDSVLYVDCKAIGKWAKVSKDKPVIRMLSSKYKCDFFRIFSLLDYINSNYMFGFYVSDDGLFSVKYKWKETAGSRAEDKRYIILKQDSDRIPEDLAIISKNKSLLLLKFKRVMW